MKIVIFGGSGDLSKRKIFPSLTKVRPIPSSIIVYSRSDISSTFRLSLAEFFHYEEAFLSRIQFVIGNYRHINLPLDTGYVFYFSVPPHVYGDLLEGLTKFKTGVIAIEKPFATDFDAFQKLVEFSHNKPEFKIVLVDHYLLKPMCVMMPVVKNSIIVDESVKSVHFIAKEELGIEGRVYFDGTGIVKDIVQNHLIELYASLMCEVPEDDTLCMLSKARNNVLEHTFIGNGHIFGQYKGYENEVGRPSKTQTYAKMQVVNTLPKYKDIAFTFLAGKGLDEKRTEIRITYRKENYKSVLESMLRTNIPHEVDRIRLSQLTLTINESDLIKKNLINKVELVLNLCPDNNVTLHVEVDNQSNVYVLFDNCMILKYFEDVYGKLDDHAVIFDCLLSGREVPGTSLEEGMNEWRIFSGFDMDVSHYYEKGCVDVEHE